MVRTVLVTGADSGIGLATVKELIREGFDVVGLVVDDQAAGTLTTEVPECRVVVADLSDPAARASVAADLRPWGIVHNAGYMNAGQIRDVPLDDARRQFEVMVIAPTDLTRQALPGMIRHGQGRIVHVTSSAVHTATPLTGWYQAAKSALREINDSLRLELHATGVDVVDIEPGGYRTGIWDGARKELSERRAGSSRQDLYDRVLDRMERMEPMMGDPVEVGRAIARALTQGDPPAHIRIGPGARWLRVLDEVMPDRLSDRWMTLAAGVR
ncbi:MAG TPA: SDR family NAD(P)-dependent oxidoreductase [Acidimicrobiales bacterium]|jgi:NAD(P)-dependent dehydrogenase (short-subunit alcohol dehydrogenase family)|nr:SDR family NAD(P)-dependent oxidoreductase [Acidimicrobiales bacterium]